MSLNPNDLTTGILVTVLVAVMVFVLPWADRRICRKYSLNLQGRLGANKEADRLLRIRQYILAAGLLLYMLIFAWLVFFSRTSSGKYVVHIAPLEDLKNAFSTPLGFTYWFRTLFSEGAAVAFSQISIVRPEDISQFYMNMMLFVPMGYLFPYVFRWFRARVRLRPVLFCLLISLLVENLQLITSRGFYDLDDLLSNVLGGWIGQRLYIALGYQVTRPYWREDRRSSRKWRRVTRHSTLRPFLRTSSLTRAMLWGSDEQAVINFYAGCLGFRLTARIAAPDGSETDLLFELGSRQLEICCSRFARIPEKQILTFSVENLTAARKRLESCGVAAGPYRPDPYSARRALSFEGPDHVEIILTEEF